MMDLALPREAMLEGDLLVVLYLGKYFVVIEVTKFKFDMLTVFYLLNLLSSGKISQKLEQANIQIICNIQQVLFVD